jgi:hypothetical protein
MYKYNALTQGGEEEMYKYNALTQGGEEGSRYHLSGCCEEIPVAPSRVIYYGTVFVCRVDFVPG